MKRAKTIWVGAAAVAATAVLPFAAQAQDEVIAVGAPASAAAEGTSFRNQGPYVGGGLGYNQVEDSTLDFRGTSTDLVTQPTVPVELPFSANTGVAAENEYKGNFWGQGVVGYRFANGLRPEFEIGYRQNEIDSITYADGTSPTDALKDSVKITATTGMFNLWYDLFPSSRFHPYIGGGVGFVRAKLNNQPTNALTSGDPLVSTPNNPLPGPPVCLFQDCDGPRKADDGALAYQAGAGIRWDMLDYLTIGLDYRYLKSGEMEFYSYEDQQETHLDTDYETQSVMLSANYFFNLPTPPAPPATPAAVALVAPVLICSDGLDNDGDGLIDFPADPGCTGTDDGDETDPPQCSDGKDNDGDGLVDFPADKGCTGADDNDEVDPCKTPAVGERVSLKGCGLGDVIVLRGVNFEFDKDRLTVNAKTILDNVAEELVAYPEITIELGGHTDAKGSDEYNQALSDRRAASVVRYLKGKDIAAERMSSAGYGEAQPVADNETDEGRELNRRVELKITSGVAPGSTTTSDGSSTTVTEGVSTEPAVEAPAADAAPAEAAPAETPAAETVPAAE